MGWLSLISDKVDFKARSITRHKEGVLVINFLSLSSKSTLHLYLVELNFTHYISLFPAGWGALPIAATGEILQD